MKEIQGKLILVRVSEPVDLSRVVCNPIQNNQEDIGSLLLPMIFEVPSPPTRFNLGIPVVGRGGTRANQDGG